MTLEEINRGIKRARHKAARVAIGLDLAERRIKHHREQRDKFQATAEKWPNSKTALLYEQKRDRAAALLHKWQKRQTKLRDKHIFLQLVLDKKSRQKHKWLKEHEDEFIEAPAGGEWVMFDGHELPRWMAEINQEARDAGYWNGYTFSGRRSKEYSQSLCENMCGATTCPGRCAGIYTNHCGPPTYQGVEYEGAQDASDSAGLIRFCRAKNKPMRGAGEVLPSDIPHCSHEGN
jgi:hypothetical protein